MIDAHTSGLLPIESQIKKLLFLFLLLSSEPCFADEYNDCILENMKDVNVASAVFLVRRACREPGEYSDCILENIKGVNVKSAVFQVQHACRERVLPYVPAKCKGLLPSENLTPPQNDYEVFKERISVLSGTIDTECVSKCLNASYWSKHFGDCKE